MKIAIIGGGIVGSTAAFYLSQTEHQIVLFDEGTGQATKAAAGIICPWFSKRRNKAWYRLANGGAHFYTQLLADLSAAGIDSSAYRRKKTWLLKKKAKQIDELIEIAIKRKEEAPLIGNIEKLTPTEQHTILAEWHYNHDVIQVEGAAVVDGANLCQDLQKAAQTNGIELQSQKAVLSKLDDKQFEINGKYFDKVIITAGPWLKEILAPHGYKVDVHPQKGQLAVYHTQVDTDSWPLIIPEGEGDIIPHHNGTLFIGASHEDEKAFNLEANSEFLTAIFSNLQPLLPDFDFNSFDEIKVGTRAYTSDYAPFFGTISDNPGILVASGLGASGLTTGPLIGYNLTKLALNETPTLNVSDYSVDNYIQKDP